MRKDHRKYFVWGLVQGEGDKYFALQSTPMDSKDAASCMGWMNKIYEQEPNPPIKWVMLSLDEARKVDWYVADCMREDARERMTAEIKSYLED